MGQKQHGPAPDKLPTDKLPVERSHSHLFQPVIATDDNPDAILKPDLDVLVTNFSYTGVNELLTNDGNGNFTATDLAGAGSPLFSEDVALGDVDGDGDLDAIITHLEAPNELLINDGNGNFSAVELPGGALSSFDVALGDIDGDGDLDALIANDGAVAANQLLTNDGSGNFTVTDLPGWSGPLVGNGGSLAIALGDVDADGDLDALVGGNYNETPNQLLINDGNGNFAVTVLPGNDRRTTDITLGDVDSDGDIDALFASSGAGLSSQLFINDGSGNFTASDLPGGITESWAVALGDIDLDGDLDALLAFSGDTGNTSSLKPNQLLTNDGTGNFVATDLPGGPRNTLGIVLGDVDGDGDLDAVIANGGDRSGNPPNQLLMNDGDGNFTLSDLPSDLQGSEGIALGDLDLDGTVPAVNEYGLPNIDLTPGTDWIL